MTAPSARITPSARTTALTTAGTRGSPTRRSSITNGASTKDSSTASVIGISTSRAKYNPATTTTPTDKVVRPCTPGTSAGATLVLSLLAAASGMTIKLSDSGET